MILTQKLFLYSSCCNNGSIPCLGLHPDCGKTLALHSQCLSLGQTYKDLEIILVDDGSSDNSGLICDEYAKQDRRIRVIHKKNQGLVLARMTGIQALDTEFVAFVDGDDWIEPDMYEKMAGIVQETGSDMVISGIIFDEEGREIPEQEIIPPGT